MWTEHLNARTFNRSKIRPVPRERSLNIIQLSYFSFLRYYVSTTASTSGIQLFRERLSEEVHATISKGIVGGFEFTDLQRNLKESHERPWT